MASDHYVEFTAENVEGVKGYRTDEYDQTPAVKEVTVEP